MATTVNDLLDVKQICIQRARRQLLIPPPTRLEILSPYPRFSMNQLAMRRKVEIFQYSANQSNSKTNNFTKAQRFSHLTSGASQRRNYSQENLKGNIPCPSDRSFPSLTSSCNVPGPIESLQYDPQVPLYNYAGVITNVPSQNNPNPDNALFLSFPSISSPISTINKAISDIVGTLFIKSVLDANSHTYQITCPVAISVMGSGSMSCIFSQIYAYIYYNNFLVATNDLSTPPTTFASSYPPPTVTLPLLSNLTWTPDNPSLTGNGSIYVGNVVTTVTLYGQPGMVYDIRYRPVLVQPVDTSIQIMFNVPTTTKTVTVNGSFSDIPPTPTSGFTIQ